MATTLSQKSVQLKVTPFFVKDEAPAYASKSIPMYVPPRYHACQGLPVGVNLVDEGYDARAYAPTKARGCVSQSRMASASKSLIWFFDGDLYLRVKREHGRCEQGTRTHSP